MTEKPEEDLATLVENASLLLVVVLLLLLFFVSIAWLLLLLKVVVLLGCGSSGFSVWVSLLVESI
jgi:hypothetical protein